MYTLLLPPSEGKTPGGSGRPIGDFSGYIYGNKVHELHVQLTHLLQHASLTQISESNESTLKKQLNISWR